MRVSDDLHHHAVAPLTVGVDDAHAEAVIAEVLDGSVLVAMDVVEKSFAVGHQELQIADLRPIDRRKVDFVEHAARGGEPDAARGGVGGADDVLGAVGPARLDSGASRGARFVLDDGHQGAFLCTRVRCAVERLERGGRLGRRIAELGLRAKHVGNADAQQRRAAAAESRAGKCETMSGGVSAAETTKIPSTA